MKNSVDSHSRKHEVLAIMSGKGGSGKTIIALAMARILSQAGFSVLVVDLDTTTHGATYFFESELSGQTSFLSLHEIFRFGEEANDQVFVSTRGFSFIPSSIRQRHAPTADVLGNIADWIDSVDQTFDYIIFDCQAGASSLNEWAASFADRVLVVLEADAVSAAAVRTLAIELGSCLSPNATWQVFNKLSEEEREIYQQVFAGTFFSNLAPLPFDWTVRAAFARLEIPGIEDTASAFGLAVLRILGTLFPSAIEELEDLEERKIGDWFRRLSELVTTADAERKKLRERVSLARKRAKKRIRMVQMGVFATSLALVGTVVALAVQNYSPGFLGVSSDEDFFYIILMALALIMGLIPTVLFDGSFRRLFSDSKESVSTLASKRLGELDREVQKYRTLLATDARFVEYSKKSEAMGGNASAFDRLKRTLEEE